MTNKQKESDFLLYINTFYDFMKKIYYNYWEILYNITQIKLNMFILMKLFI